MLSAGFAHGTSKMGTQCGRKNGASEPCGKKNFPLEHPEGLPTCPSAMRFQHICGASERIIDMSKLDVACETESVRAEYADSTYLLLPEVAVLWQTRLVS